MAQERVDNLFASESWSAVYTAFTNISLKAYDFDTIREALLSYVAQTYPDKFNDFIASSEFVAILDIVAYLGHSLTFRNDMNTRENFLDTAERRESVLRMAKTLGYNKTRPINSRGFMKITSVKTDQVIYDNNGNSLANRKITWNDSNNAEWYDDFVTILNAALAQGSTVESPAASYTSMGIENYLHHINENPKSKSVKYSFTAPIASKQRNFEVVRAAFEDDTINEATPDIRKSMTIIGRNDSLGPASDRTGFFFYTKIGNLKYKDVSYTTQLSNRIEQILDTNISNTDVWVQRTDATGAVQNEVVKVDNDTRETAIYHSIKNGNGDIVSVHTLQDNKVELVFSDGIFGNAAYGSYRIWYRIADNETFRVNKDDVKDVSLTIPYIGKDSKEYRLFVTLKSTRDFTENFEGENYISVKRIAPRSYYAQDRMVNAQDYNVLPLSMGTNVVSKLKAVNTTHAGKSRFFEMDDVTGHHSNVHVTGADGSVYLDDDTIKLRLPYNRLNGDLDSFIRNDLSNAMKHPSFVNMYYDTYMFDPKYDARDLYIPWIRDTSNILRGIIDFEFEVGTPISEGDYIQIVDSFGEHPTWFRVVSYGIDQYVTLDSVPPETGTILRIVKSHRTKFNDAEVETIKNYVISSGYVEPFWIWYDSYNWMIWYEGIEDDIADPSLDEDFAAAELKMYIEYIPGFRRNDAEFVVTFDGKKVVFESSKEVKFYYSNGEIVVDQKTNLAKQDKLFINYYSGETTLSNIETSETQETLTIGSVQVSSPDYNTVDNTVTFDADFKCVGAAGNFEFINSRPEISQVSYRHILVSPDCIEYDVTPTEDTVIGTSPAYTISFDLDEASSYLVELDEISIDAGTVETLENVVAGEPVSAVGDSSSVADAISSTITVTYDFLKNSGFVGEPTAEYFVEAQTNKTFFWVDFNEMPVGMTLDSIGPNDYGSRADYLVTIDNTNPNNPVFEFTIPYDETKVDINSLDSDIYFKQLARSEVAFEYLTDPLAEGDIFIRDSEGNLIDPTLWTLIDLGGGSYKIVFWQTVTTLETIDIYRGIPGAEDFSQHILKVVCDFAFTSQTNVETQKYEVSETYIYDKFITDAGYIDDSKVKLLTLDSVGNPFGVLDIFRYSDQSAYIILETYYVDDIAYEKVSSTAISAQDNEYLPENALIWYNETTGTWFRKYVGEWTPITPVEISSSTHISYGNIEYRVVEGRSYVDDMFMSFRWDHYADADKRIDPSTSNIIDLYILTTDYVNAINTWIAGGYRTSMPTPPNNFELKKLMQPIIEKASISDHISFVPAKFKMLFGDVAEQQNQAIFKVIKREGTTYTDSEIKTQVSTKVNQYFGLSNWDFGDKFYFSELAAYLHTELSDMVASVVIAPKYATTDFKDLLSISCDPNEIFLGVTTSKDVKIVTNITTSELTGE